MDEAARRVGVTTRDMRRKCKSELRPARRARHMPGPDGGQSKWWVHRSWDDRLRGSGLGPDLDESLAHVPLGKRLEASQRAVCVQRFREAKRGVDARYSGAVGDWLPTLIRDLQAEHPDLSISRSRLYQWDKDYGHDGDQVAHGRRPRRHPRGRASASGAGTTLPRSTSTRISPKWPTAGSRPCCSPERRGCGWCAQGTCRRQLDTKIPPETQAFARDKALYNSKYKPTLEQQAERFDPGRCWVGDHTRLDFFVRIGERVFRPWLTTWQDWRTRRIVGWCLCESPNTDTIRFALHQGLVDEVNMGGPEHVIVDKRQGLRRLGVGRPDQAAASLPETQY